MSAREGASGAKKVGLIWIFFILLVVSFFASMVFGAVKLPLNEIIHVLFHETETKHHLIIAEVRLPRSVIACIVGMCLGVSGCIMQGITRNPMASPSILGVTNGASLVTFALFIFAPSAYRLVPIAAFIGALATTLLIYTMAWKGGVNPTRFILSGVAVGSVISAVHSVLTTMFPDALAGMVGFNVGSLSARTWDHVFLILPYALVALVLSFLFSSKINILGMGDEVATGLGVKVEQVRMILIVLSSLLAACSVSVAGMIGFIGLCIPHMTRMVMGSDYRYLLPACAINGATTLVLCDTLSRVIIAPKEMPVGVILSAIGAPFFLYLLRKQEKM